MKKMTSMLLVVSILLSLFTLSASSLSEEQYPFVLVRGMEFNGLTVNYGTAQAEPAIKPVNSKLIASALKDCLWGFFIGGRTGALTALCDTVKYVLGNMGINPDGTSTYNISLRTYPLAVSNYPELLNSLGNGNEEGIIKGAVEKYGADSCYYFRYDWRLDPYYNADGIRRMIEQAKNDHNCDKVNLVCCSMGGIVTVAYMSEYGSASLNKAIFLSTAFCGTYVASDVLQGKAHIGEKELYNFAVNKFPDYEGIFTMLRKTYILNMVTTILNKCIERNKEFVYAYALRDIFGTMPALWALVQPDSYEDCINFIFPTDELKREYSIIISLAEKYQKMTASRDAVLKKAQSDGTAIAIVATYGVPLIPVYERACASGDGTLETAPMLGNATVANHGETLYETLGEDYTSRDAKYISPDGAIDMSTGIFPDYTWCFKGVSHISCCYKTDMQEFLFWLTDYEGQPTVYTNPEYPQYMLSSPANEIR